VAIDFRLTAAQRELQLRSRKVAKEVLSPAIEAETLLIPEERFAATRPALRGNGRRRASAFR
jgi:nitroalkane oxidase